MFVAMADLLPNIVAVMDVSRAECSSGAHICSDATIISHSKLVICQRTVSMFCVAVLYKYTVYNIKNRTLIPVMD